ncbi:cyclase family protein [Paenibacillus senegalensis]|uniref:cyclase family protein n=1 Tax=Paenibacillus senegalensis TaxID=1465766 RepID=UPI000289EA62|nr:cyclase family protein [Paenibacillus senegalensis]
MISRMKYIDLSEPLHSGMEIYPGDPVPSFDVVHTHEEHTWELRQLRLGSHTGTHVDAFSHMHKGGKTLDDIPLDHFFGKAVRVLPDSAFPAKTGLLFAEVVGIEVLPTIVEAKPPFVGGELSEALERSLLEEEIVTYTQLANLQQLPLLTPFWFFGLPLKITGGDGSPVRAIALLEDDSCRIESETI